MSKNQNPAVIENPVVADDQDEAAIIRELQGASDPADPSLAWVSMLESGVPNANYARKGAREMLIGGLTYDEFITHLIADCAANPKHTAVRVLIDGTDFETSQNSSLDSNAKRIARALCNDAKRVNPLVSRNLTVRQITKGSVIGNAADGSKVLAPQNAIRLQYVASADQVAAYRLANPAK